MVGLRGRAVFILIALAAPCETIRYRTLLSPVIERRLAAVRHTNVDRELTLRDLFTEAGCPADRLQEQSVKRSKVPNLICVMPGEIEAVIITGAHFDFVDAGDGVIDNWSGASLLPSLFESLKTVPRRHTFVFAAFTDEEKGMVGSSFYLDRMSKQDRGKITAMVNLDSLGTSSTKIEMDRGDKRLALALYDVSQTFKLPLTIVNVHKVGRSDSDSFQDRKIPSLNIHSVTNETFPILHSKLDRASAIRMGDYYDSYRLVAAYLAYLDQILDPAAKP